jgi:hypothetical protein
LRHKRAVNFEFKNVQNYKQENLGVLLYFWVKYFFKEYPQPLKALEGERWCEQKHLKAGTEFCS